MKLQSWPLDPAHASFPWFIVFFVLFLVQVYRASNICCCHGASAPWTLPIMVHSYFKIVWLRIKLWPLSITNSTILRGYVAKLGWNKSGWIMIYGYLWYFVYWCVFFVGWITSWFIAASACRSPRDNSKASWPGVSKKVLGVSSGDWSNLPEIFDSWH